MLDELSAKYTFRELKKQENFFFKNHLIYRGHSRKFHWLMPLILNYYCTKWLNKENNRNGIFNFNPFNFFFPISLLQYLEVDFRKEKYFNLFPKLKIENLSLSFCSTCRDLSKTLEFLLYDLCN